MLTFYVWVCPSFNARDVRRTLSGATKVGVAETREQLGALSSAYSDKPIACSKPGSNELIDYKDALAAFLGITARP